MSHTAQLEIIAEAREWIGTPFFFNQRLKGHAVDCGNLVAAIAENVKLVQGPVNTPTFTADWQSHTMEERICNLLEQFGCTQIPIEERQPGDILTFNIGRGTRVQAHLAIQVSETRIVHATNKGEAKVVETELSGSVLARLGRVYRFPAYPTKEQND